MNATALIAAASVAGLACAMPLEARQSTCTYSYNPDLYWISQHQPEDSNGPTNIININQDIGLVDIVASFTDIPSTAYGCTLEFNFIPDPSANVYGTGNPQQINVYALPDTLPAEVNWDNVYPLKGSLVGTWNFPTGTALNTPELITINSFSCASTMNYLFEVADTWSVKGGIGYTDTDTQGIAMAYNC